MARFTYKGMPTVQPNGTMSVQPFRSLKDPTSGDYYKGVVGVDAQGNRFVYNKVPDDYSATPITYAFLLGTPPPTAGTIYRWEDDKAWNDALTLMA